MTNTAHGFSIARTHKEAEVTTEMLLAGNTPKIILIGNDFNTDYTNKLKEDITDNIPKETLKMRKGINHIDTVNIPHRKVLCEQDSIAHTISLKDAFPNISTYQELIDAHNQLRNGDINGYQAKRDGITDKQIDEIYKDKRVSMDGLKISLSKHRFVVMPS